MSELANGILVEHRSLGVGRVVAVEATAVHVFFPESEKRHAAKLRWPLARPLLKTEGVQRNAWLEGLSSFSLDPVAGRYALVEDWLTHDQAVAAFLEQCPGGFTAGDSAAGPAGRNKRTARWQAARAGWAELLGGGRGEALLAKGDVADLARRAVRLERLVAPIAGVLEDGALRDAFEDAEAARPYFEALFGLLSGPVPGRARAERLFAAAAGLKAAPGSAWGLATLFPFLADPARHLVLLPKLTRSTAERLGCDLRYDATPNWATYAALRGFAGQLLERLKAIGAHDFIDVEAFLHVIGTRRPAASRAGPPGGKRSRPATPGGSGRQAPHPAPARGRP